MIFLQPVVPIHRVHQGKCVLKQHKQSAHSVHFEHELPLSVCRGTRESINLRHYPGYKSKRMLREIKAGNRQRSKTTGAILSRLDL
jgi:hypothetical protein